MSSSVSKRIFLLFWIVPVFISCVKEEDDRPAAPLDSRYGLLICNEGPFNSGTGTISFWEQTGYIENEVFQKCNNGLELGNIVQSAVNIGQYIFVVVNNSGKIRVLDKSTFKLIYTFENINLPRYIIQSDDTHAYISCWDNTVKELDLSQMTVTNLFPAGTGPEKMLKVNDKVWVLNRGGFSIDSTVTVIDIQSGEIDTTFMVFPKPTGIVTDKNGMVWVLCSGHGWNGVTGVLHTAAHLVNIDPLTYSFVDDFEFPDNEKHPEQLVVDDKGEVLYYLYVNGVCKFDISSSSLNATPFIWHETMFYSIYYSKQGNVIFCTDPVDYVQNGWVYKFNAETGTPLDSVKAGIIPGEMIFLDRD